MRSNDRLRYASKDMKSNLPDRFRNSVSQQCKNLPPMAPNTIETLRLLIVSSEVSVLRLLVRPRSQTRGIWKPRLAVGMRWSECNPILRPICSCWIFLEANGDGLHLLPWLRRLRPELPIVRAVRPEDAGRQKEATRMGAKDVLTRPVTRGTDPIPGAPTPGIVERLRRSGNSERRH